MSTISDLNQRVTGLERRLNLWRNTAAVVGLSAACLTALGASGTDTQTLSPPGAEHTDPGQGSLADRREQAEMFAAKQATDFTTLRIRRLEIVNGSHDLVCVIGTASDGDPVLRMYGANGSDLAYMGAATEGGALAEYQQL